MHKIWGFIKWSGETKIASIFKDIVAIALFGLSEQSSILELISTCEGIRGDRPFRSERHSEDKSALSLFKKLKGKPELKLTIPLPDVFPTIFSNCAANEKATGTLWGEVLSDTIKHPALVNSDPGNNCFTYEFSV